MATKIEPIQWHGCYDLQWAGVITPASMAHPAKYSRGLITRIFDHCLERGYLKKGDIIGDCFGGVGTGGVMAAYAGLRWIGVELEPRFVTMARRNFALHTSKWRRISAPRPVILRGDSRKFDELIGQVVGIVSSPPFTQGYSSGGGINVKGYGPNGEDKVGNRTYQGTGADRSTGNIETLPAGDLSAVVSSPPYRGERDDGGSKGGKMNDEGGIQFRSGKGYGSTNGQIGDTPTPETYWQAVRDVYAACHRAIKPGGVLVLVLKDYVKAKKRVPLADDTVTLCESLGFVLIERIQAMLVSETRHANLFGGEDVQKKSRKSFFRRMAESKGSPEINHEDVLIFRRA